jgi:hypothetical protein
VGARVLCVSMQRSSGKLLRVSQVPTRGAVTSLCCSEKGGVVAAADERDGVLLLRFRTDTLELEKVGGHGPCDAKVANRVTLGEFREAVSRRPPISLHTMVPRTGGYAYDVGVWDLSITQGPFSVSPCQTLAA